MPKKKVEITIKSTAEILAVKKTSNEKISKLKQSLESRQIRAKGKETIVCKIPGCGRTLTSWSGFYKHVDAHEREPKYSCDYPGCNQKFSIQPNLIRHRETEHSEDNRFVCDICNLSLAAKSTLKRHMKTHNDNRETYTCSNCNQNFISKEGFERHLKLHEEARPFPCPDCDKSFVDLSGLNSHQKTHGGPTLCCDIDDCSEKYITTSALNRHKKSKHEGIKFSCSISGCNKEYTRKEGLDAHKLSFHDGQRPFRCEFLGCNQSFSEKCTLNNHQRIHDGLRPFKCDHPNCGATFTQKGGLMYHLLTHSSLRPWICDVPGCEMKFKTKGALVAHQIVHTTERKYHCEFCPLLFKTSSLLRSHQARHHLGKCKVCVEAGQSIENAPWIHYKYTKEQLCYSCAQFRLGTEKAFRVEHLLADYLYQKFNSHPNVLAIYLNKEDPDSDKCSRFRPDIRILLHSGETILVEVDEHGHVDYTCKIKDMHEKWLELQLGTKSGKLRRKVKEDSRVSQIVTTGTIDRTVVFRFNPDDYTNENDQTFASDQIPHPESGTPMTIDPTAARLWRFEKLEQDIWEFIDGNWDQEELTFIHVVYWFYEGPERYTDFVPVDGDEYRLWISKVQALAKD